MLEIDLDIEKILIWRLLLYLLAIRPPEGTDNIGVEKTELFLPSCSLQIGGSGHLSQKHTNPWLQSETHAGREQLMLLSE